MKKLIAILFLSLICLTTVSDKLSVQEIGYELTADSDETDPESKEGKKEIKEFTTPTEKRPFAGLLIDYRYKVSRTFIFPQPFCNEPVSKNRFTNSER